MFLTPSEAGVSITSETGAPSVDGISCTCGMDCNGVSVLLLFSGAKLGLWIGVSLGSSSRYLVNQSYLSSISSDTTLCDLHFTRYVQFEGIVPSLMNLTVVNSSSNTTWNWGETWLVDGFITIDTDTELNGEWPI